MPAYKNIGIQTVRRRDNIIFACLLCMLSSLFISRLALSLSAILFVLLAVVHKGFVQQVKRFAANAFLLSVAFLFFIPLISGLWSSNIEKWGDVMRLKLPLLFFPLAFAGSWQLDKKKWVTLTVFLIALVFLGCAWSLIHYAGNVQEIHAGYLKAKTLLTPLENDHVRFSWLVSIAIISCCLLAQTNASKKSRYAFYIVASLLAVYLHILSARTGLISLYIFLLLWASWFLFRQKSLKNSLTLLFLLIALPVLAYFVVPTFQNRIRYLIYDFSFVEKKQYLPGSNDGARMMSLRAGWHVLQQQPFGVGAGDIMHEADKWYALQVPDVLPSDKFYPSSEWLLYGLFAGWAGVVLFTAIMLLPFFLTIKKHRLFWLALHATAAFSFAFDMGLEVQYGIFLYAFLTCWWWKWMNP